MEPEEVANAIDASCILCYHAVPCYTGFFSFKEPLLRPQSLSSHRTHLRHGEQSPCLFFLPIAIRPFLAIHHPLPAISHQPTRRFV